MKKLVGGLVCLSALLLIVGCGVSKRALEDAERRIEALKSKGVPDSSLSRAKVFYYQAKAAKERGDLGLARTSADSMRYLIARAEEDFEQESKRLKPVIDSLQSVVLEAKRDLDGLHKDVLDSIVAKADSFAALGWALQTENVLRQAVGRIPALKFQQERAAELRPRVPGVWKMTQRTTSEAHREVNAVETKEFTFEPDGDAKLVEEKHGQSGTHLKENWKFLSWGTYGLKGDTIFMKVDRFKAAQQDFMEKFVDENGRVEWKPKKEPTYDSTITDGSQDRFIAFEDLRRDFKKVRSF